MEATVTESKAKIRPNTEGMVKGKGGSFHKDDFVGTNLAGLTIDQVKAIATDIGIDAAKYDHLNVGQQRMNLGNRIRPLVTHKDGQKEEAGEAIDANRDRVVEMADGFRAANESAAAEAAAAKEAEKAERAAAKKPAKVKVSDPDPVDGEGDTPD